MSESFPFKQTGNYLEDDDFSLFSNSYRQLIAARIPSAGKIYFVHVQSTLPKLSSDPRKGAELSCLIERMLSGQLTSQILDDNILLSFRLSDARYLVAVVSQLDEFVVQKASVDWLEDCREKLLLDFLLVKRSYKDPETGLLNSTHLFTLLQSPSVGQKFEIFLVGVPPRSRELNDAFRNAQKASVALVTFAESRFLIHHLGQCVFALLSTQTDTASVAHFSSRLVNYLKKENFYRVHVGSSRQGASGNDASTSEGILDQAWTALQTAGQRGPFSFCDFSLLANSLSHPLRPPHSKVIQLYRKLNRQNDRFCLVKLSRPVTVEEYPRIAELLELPNSALILGLDRGCIVYLPDCAAEEGLRFAEKSIEKLGSVSGITDVFAGVSAYPFRDFSRTETLFNVQKALLHAAFFGTGHAVLFDAVSLNVSGDIYYGDGDLPQAVLEYRRGLDCDPRDVNLLNSLGVAYALLNKSGLARSTFESVLEIDDTNYMAFYNLGLGAHLRGDLTKALECFDKAYGYCDASGEDADLCQDLKVQLGQLYCQLGKYEASLRYLEEWQVDAAENQQGPILRFLGESYLGVGQPKMAMELLQRALRRSEFDHDILSLLGTAVWRACEGDDIALALCGKSVDLAPDNSQLRVRLARVQLHTGHYESALGNLRKCRGKNVDIVEVQLLKAEVYQKLRHVGRLKYWAKKAQQHCSRNSEPYRQAQVLLESIQE